MSRWRGFHSLGGKLGVAFSLVMTVGALALSIVSYRGGKDILQREARARYESIAVSLAFNAEYGVLTRNRSSLGQMAGGVMQEKDVNFISITDAKGQILAEAGARAEPGMLVAKPVFLRRASGPGDLEYFFGEMDPHPAPVPSGGVVEKIGDVMIEFNTDFILQRLGEIRRQAAIASALTVVVGFIASMLLARLLVAPLKGLVDATAQVARGDLSHQVVAQSRDEIGELAKDFNIMIRNLKEFTVSRDYLGSLLDSIPDAILVVEGSGKLKGINAGAATLSGYGEQELLGQPLGAVLSLEQSRVRTKEGDSVPVSVSRGELRGDDGEAIGTVYVAHDVRPMQKLQERLLQTEKMAAVGQLAAGVAHEINNPLGVILGFAQGLCRRLTPDHPMEVPLKSIERESMRCKDLVQDLLTFSRASHAEREPVDINTAVEGALTLIQAQARMDSARVQMSLAQSLPRVFGSKSQIQQVVINLAKNALDAMPKGGTVSVVTELEEAGIRSWVCLRVRDEGEGIPPEVLPRIFDPFFTTKPVGKGTGLGLALVYEIIKKHSGLLDVKSRPGLTEFVIKFPVRTGRESAKKDGAPTGAEAEMDA